MFYGILYTITAVFMVSNGLRPLAAYVLPIEEEHYYFWQLFFTIPVSVLGWLVLGIAAYLVARRVFKSSAPPRCFLNLLAFSFYVPLIIAMWIPENIVASVYRHAWGEPAQLGLCWKWLGEVYLWVGFAWAIGLSAIAVRQTGVS